MANTRKSPTAEKKAAEEQKAAIRNVSGFKHVIIPYDISPNGAPPKNTTIRGAWEGSDEEKQQNKDKQTQQFIFSIDGNKPGWSELLKDVNRNVKLQGKTYHNISFKTPAETQEFLENIFSSQSGIKTLMSHYSQLSMLFAASPLSYSYKPEDPMEERIAILDPDFHERETNIFEKNGDVYINVKIAQAGIRAIFDRTTTHMITGPAEVVFKAEENGFQLQYIATNNKILNNLYLGKYVSGKEIEADLNDPQQLKLQEQFLDLRNKLKDKKIALEKNLKEIRGEAIPQDPKNTEFKTQKLPDKTNVKKIADILPKLAELENIVNAIEQYEREEINFLTLSNHIAEAHKTMSEIKKSGLFGNDKNSTRNLIAKLAEILPKMNVAASEKFTQNFFNLLQEAKKFQHNENRFDQIHKKLMHFLHALTPDIIKENLRQLRAIDKSLPEKGKEMWKSIQEHLKLIPNAEKQIEIINAGILKFDQLAQKDDGIQKAVNAKLNIRDTADIMQQLAAADHKLEHKAAPAPPTTEPVTPILTADTQTPLTPSSPTVIEEPTSTNSSADDLPARPRSPS